jgi:hypothetical protein
MYALIGLAVFIAFVELAAVFGWGTDSRDGHDWTPAGPEYGRHGATRVPRSWRS